MRPICKISRPTVTRFLDDEDGAATVDFVVLTAAIVGLSIALYTLIGDATDDHADRIGSKIDEYGIRTY